MNKLTRLSLILIMMALASPALAADPVAKLRDVRGTVEIRRAGASNWTQARDESKLYAGDTVRAMEKSSATIFQNGVGIHPIKPLSSVTIQKAARETVAQNDTSSMTARLWRRLDSKISKRESGIPSAVLGTRKAVLPTDVQLVLLSPRNTALPATGPITFKWRLDALADFTYHITVTGKEDILWEQDATATEITYPASATALVPGMIYYWTVEATDETGMILEADSNSVYFSILDVSDELAALSRELDDSETDKMTRSLLLGAFYEDKHLYENAVKEYKYLIEKAPDVPLYHDMLCQVYAEINLKEPSCGKKPAAEIQSPDLKN